MQKNKHATFYCFSPLVMILTVVIEIGLLIKVLFWRKPTTANVLAMLILFSLGLFQAMEYGICEGLFGLNIHPNVLARIGFVAITALPALGLHLIQTLGKSKQHVITVLAYGSMISWMAVFLLSDALLRQTCSSNYIIFDMSPGFGASYFAYYYFWLIIGSVLALNIAMKTKSKKLAKSLRWLVVSYASFTVPATFMWLFWEDIAEGLPSIMCGFAVLFAIILYTKVLPRDSH